MLYDADIREPLFDFLETIYSKNRIIEEMTIGKSRADVVMVTDEAIFGLEIKSDADTYVRLARQVKDYSKYFDYNYVVVGTSHATHVDEHIPEHWGVITVEEVEGELDFYILRKPSDNPKVKMRWKLDILWRPELAMLQSQNGMPKYKNKSKYFVIKSILERCELPEDKKGRIDIHNLQRQLCEILFERDYNSVDELLSEYYKGELQKQIEAEEDPERIKELKKLQEEKSKNFEGVTRKRYRRRRRRRK